MHPMGDPTPVPVGEPPGLTRVGTPQSGRRRLLALAVLVAMVLGGLVLWRTQHFGGDPKGALLASLRTQVDAALPPGSTVVATHSSEPVWLTQGCDGSIGWTTVVYGVTFRSDLPPAAVLAHTDHVLAASGWRPVRPTGTWLHSSDGRSWLSLSGPSSAGSGGNWHLGGDVPPYGKAVQQC